MTLTPRSMARPPPAANNITTGHAQAGGVKHQMKPTWARSTGVRNELGELFGWFHVSEGFAGSVVEAAGDYGQFFGGVDRQVGAFGHVLAEQAISVLVRAALPGLVRVTEVDRDAGGDGEPGVEG